MTAAEQLNRAALLRFDQERRLEGCRHDAEAAGRRGDDRARAQSSPDRAADPLHHPLHPLSLIMCIASHTNGPATRTISSRQQGTWDGPLSGSAATCGATRRTSSALYRTLEAYPVVVGQLSVAIRTPWASAFTYTE